MKERKSNKQTNQEQLYVVETYTSWTDPKHQTEICTLAELKELQKHVDEVEAVYELGRKVKVTFGVTVE